MTYTNPSNAEKKEVIEWMTENLQELRMKTGMTREEIANVIGIARQNYSELESKKREMSWSILLSLLFVFECNQNSRAILDENRDVLNVVYKSMNSDSFSQTNSANTVTESILSGLDERAKENLAKLLNIEQARCLAEQNSQE